MELEITNSMVKIKSTESQDNLVFNANYVKNKRKEYNKSYFVQTYQEHFFMMNYQI